MINNLKNYNFNAKNLKDDQIKITNTSYITNNKIIHGPVQRIKDVNIIPSPYLNGSLDYFFFKTFSSDDRDYRGCPFSCSFCSDGAKK